MSQRTGDRARQFAAFGGAGWDNRGFRVGDVVTNASGERGVVERVEAGGWLVVNRDGRRYRVDGNSEHVHRLPR